MEQKYARVCVVYYSPTRTSKKIAEAIAAGMTSEQFHVIDLTTDSSTDTIEVTTDWIVLASPVYAGRIPVEAVERFKRIKAVKKDGRKTNAVIAVVYGNRDYDDALIELKNISESLNLLPVSGGAFIGEHSFSREMMPVGEGRPDKNDLAVAMEFGRNSLRCADNAADGALSVKGNVPYRNHMEVPPVSPESTEDCNLCGKCIHVCPVHAITLADQKIVTDAEKCTLCCACVKMCPSKARVFDTPFTKVLFDNCKARREPELFYVKK